MLVSFEIRNINSLRNKTTFSMEAVPELTEHPTNSILLNDNIQLLKVASIYGPNASGKSNVLYSLRFLKDLVSGNLAKESNRRFPVELSHVLRPYSPFEFSTDKDMYIDASYLFYRDGYEYWYTIKAEYVNDDYSYIKMINECLAFKNSDSAQYNLLFSREDNLIQADELVKDIGISRLVVSNDMTLLQHLYINYISTDLSNNLIIENNSTLMHIYNMYEEIQSIMYINGKQIGAYMGRYGNQKIMAHKTFIIESLQKLDIDITDIILRKDLSREESISCVHKINNINFELKLEQESQGTIILINLLSRISGRKDQKTIYIIDELDSNLHPKLVRAIIALFNSNENKSNQLIYNSHDMWNMSPDIFRRDQIWFTFRNEKFETELMSLSDIVNYKGERVRKDAKYSKQYMEGKYGADPFIKGGLDWFEQKQ